MSELYGSDAYSPREVARRVETVGVAKARLALLPAHAFVANVGRGPVIEALHACAISHDEDADPGRCLARLASIDRAGAVDLMFTNDPMATAMIARGVADIHGRGRQAVALDFDRDGLLDIAVANEGPSFYPTPNRLFRNNPDGRFTDMTASPVTSEKRSLCAAAGDLDGDGWPELIFCAGDPGDPIRTVTFKNVGGSFVETTATSLFRAIPSRSIKIVDLDRDGRMDVLIVEQSRLRIWLNTASGLPASPSYTRAIAEGRDVAVGDVNNDGRLDLYVCTGWSGGAYGTGSRMKLSYTRAMIRALLDLHTRTGSPDYLRRAAKALAALDAARTNDPSCRRPNATGWRRWHRRSRRPRHNWPNGPNPTCGSASRRSATTWPKRRTSCSWPSARSTRRRASCSSPRSRRCARTSARSSSRSLAVASAICDSKTPTRRWIVISKFTRRPAARRRSAFTCSRAANVRWSRCRCSSASSSPSRARSVSWTKWTRRSTTRTSAVS